MGFRRLFEHAAAQGGAISLHYQPTIEHASGTILYLEALLRWPYMQRVAPIPEIIRVAEESKDYRDWETDRKSTRLNSSHSAKSRMPSSA